MKDIRRHQVEAGSLLWMSPVELAGDWRCSILVPGATNWHMLLVCCKPPTRHTCYMCVAKNGISAPLQNMVWRQQRVPLSTCLPRKQPTHTCNRVFVHEDGLKDNSSAKITCTDTHTAEIGHVKTGRCRCADLQACTWENSLRLHYNHTHTHSHAHTNMYSPSHT